MTTQTTTAPDQVLKKDPPPPLRHFLCSCQNGKRPSYGRCGVELGGKPENSSQFGPMELCGMCTLMREEKTPCRFCGKPAS